MLGHLRFQATHKEFPGDGLKLNWNVKNSLHNIRCSHIKEVRDGGWKPEAWGNRIKIRWDSYAGAYKVEHNHPMKSNETYFLHCSFSSLARTLIVLHPIPSCFLFFPIFFNESLTGSKLSLILTLGGLVCFVPGCIPKRLSIFVAFSPSLFASFYFINIIAERKESEREEGEEVLHQHQQNQL